MYCNSCGKEIMSEAVICPHCGCTVNGKILMNSDNKKENKSYVSIILGILGGIFAWIFALIGHVLSIIGIIFAIKEYKKNKTIVGLIICIIGEMCSITSSIIGVLIVNGIL